MTAEGDNRVLMQKIVKDILSDLQKNKHVMPKMTQCPKRQIPALKSVANLETLINLVYFREVQEIKSFAKMMQKKIMVDGKQFFDVWMYEVSDEIQSLSTSYGHRFMVEAAAKHINAQSHAGVKKLLNQALFVHLIHLVKSNLDWYLINGVISQEAAAALDDEWQQAVKDFVPYTNTSLESLGIPKHLHVSAPIIRDYVAFNKQTNPENIDAAGDLFDWKQTGGPRSRARL